MPRAPVPNHGSCYRGPRTRERHDSDRDACHPCSGGVGACGGSHSRASRRRGADQGARGLDQPLVRSWRAGRDVCRETAATAYSGRRSVRYDRCRRAGRGAVTARPTRRCGGSGPRRRRRLRRILSLSRRPAQYLFRTSSTFRRRPVSAVTFQPRSTCSKPLCARASGS
jgi:hypothetical protein